MADDDLRAKHKDNDKDHRPEDEIWQRSDTDTLDLEFDAALAGYAAVEPRAGLEERVLANLRVERDHAPAYAWWRGTAFAALAAVLLVALTLLLRSGDRRLDTVTRDHAHTTQDGASSGTRVPPHHGSEQIRPSHPAAVRFGAHIPRHLAAVAAADPRLDQFPSPQPLSEQEKILESYVAKYSDHAALVAQARTEELRRDHADEMGQGASASDEASPQSNR